MSRCVCARCTMPGATRCVVVSDNMTQSVYDVRPGCRPFCPHQPAYRHTSPFSFHFMYSSRQTSQCATASVSCVCVTTIFYLFSLRRLMAFSFLPSTDCFVFCRSPATHSLSITPHCCIQTPHLYTIHIYVDVFFHTKNGVYIFYSVRHFGDEKKKKTNVVAYTVNHTFHIVRHATHNTDVCVSQGVNAPCVRIYVENMTRPPPPG